MPVASSVSEEAEDEEDVVAAAATAAIEAAAAAMAAERGTLPSYLLCVSNMDGGGIVNGNGGMPELKDRALRQFCPPWL